MTGTISPAATVVAATTSVAIRPAPAAPAVEAESGARTFLGKVERAIADLATLRTVTVVTPVTVALNPAGSVTVAPRPDGAGDAPAEAIVTEINLLTGDITTVISPAFAPGGRLDGLRDYHAQQVAKSGETITTLLTQVSSLARDLLHG